MSETVGVPGEDVPVLLFRDGIPGFPHSRRFVLTDVGDDGAFQVLESLDEDGVAMVVSVPWLFFPDYAPDLTDKDRTDLGIDSPNDAVVFCSVTLEADPDTAYVNLLGPFIVNAQTNEGRQVILTDTSMPVRAPVRLS